MSAQAMGWALDQSIPSRAKLLLVALANHADQTTGYCWPSIDTLMRETSMSRRAVFGYLGALRRNGYVESKPAHGKDGRQRSNDYWILFDRAEAEWQHLKTDEENYSTSELPADEDTKIAPLPENVAKTIPAPPRDNPCTPIIEPSDSNRQTLQLIDGQQLKLGLPKDFSSNARLREQERLQAAEEARKAGLIGVIEGSKPWFAHVREGHSPTLVGTVIIDGKRHRGWYFSSLYPPKATGPPLPNLLTEEDEEELRNWG